jgi:hypothetical protein
VWTLGLPAPFAMPSGRVRRLAGGSARHPTAPAAAAGPPRAAAREHWAPRSPPLLPASAGAHAAPPTVVLPTRSGRQVDPQSACCTWPAAPQLHTRHWCWPPAARCARLPLHPQQAVHPAPPPPPHPPVPCAPPAAVRRPPPPPCSAPAPTWQPAQRCSVEQLQAGHNACVLLPVPSCLKQLMLPALPLQPCPCDGQRTGCPAQADQSQHPAHLGLSCKVMRDARPPRLSVCGAAEHTGGMVWVDGRAMALSQAFSLPVTLLALQRISTPGRLGMPGLRPPLTHTPAPPTKWQGSASLPRPPACTRVRRKWRKKQPAERCWRR